MPGYVYILASRRNGKLYIGVTTDLIRITYQHKSKEIKGFTSQYKVDQLVYYEIYDDVSEAIVREKRLKKWNRAWKIKLIEGRKPNWKDLYDTF